MHSNSLVSTRREKHENAQQEENEALVMLGRGKRLYLFEIYVWRPPFPLAVDGITMGGQEGLVEDAGFRHTLKQTQGYSKVRPITQQVISFNKTSLIHRIPADFVAAHSDDPPWFFYHIGLGRAACCLVCFVRLWMSVELISLFGRVFSSRCVDT